MALFQHEQRKLNRLGHALMTSFPGQIEAIYAFGSRLSKKNFTWPDFDLLIIIHENTFAMKPPAAVWPAR